jgi:hypothetical protein
MPGCIFVESNNMSQIQQYNLTYDSIQTIEVSLRSEILTATAHSDGIWLYVASNPNALKTTKNIVIVRTDESMPSGDYKYITTIEGVSVAFHLFEIK